MNHIKNTSKKKQWTMNPQGSDLYRQIRFWTTQSLTNCGDKGGSFNVDLYVRYLIAKHHAS